MTTRLAMTSQPTNDLLNALAAVLRQPVPKEFCCECGGVYPSGSHVWVDIDGVEHPGCTNYDRGQAYLWGMRQFLGYDEPDESMKIAKGYAVK